MPKRFGILNRLAKYHEVRYHERRHIMAVDKIDKHLDLRGKVCPDPTFEPSLALKDMAVGEVLEVVTDYYPARQTIPDLMNDLGYSYELVDGDKPVFRFLIRKS
jgi:tRNA 2-thiouridine synthesizing protein A